MIPDKYLAIAAAVQGAMHTGNTTSLNAFSLADLKMAKHHLSLDSGMPYYSLLLDVIKDRESADEHAAPAQLAQYDQPRRKGTGDKPSVFLSHSSQDKFFVRELASKLRQTGVKVWIDEAEINVGDSLVEKIGVAISDTDFVAAVLSHNSIESTWVQRELNLAMQEEFSRRKVVVLPILLEKVTIPPFLRDKLYADFTDPERANTGFESLLRALGVQNTTPTMPTESGREDRPIRQDFATQAGNRLANFEDIRLTGLDDRKTYNPDPSKGMYNVALRLSAAPPSEWKQIFDAERTFPRHTMWRRAWIEGSHIIVYCALDEVERYHVPDLKDDVAKANASYRAYITEQARLEAKKEHEKQTIQTQITDLKAKLKFD